MTDQTDSISVRYRISGMDCPSCAAKIEAAARSNSSVTKARVSLTTRELSAEVSESEALPVLEQAISGLGYSLQRVEEQDAPAYQSSSYRRALWIVIILNIGYGIIEAVGGFIADSQALQADALDFLGDGSITLLGLLAIGWTPRWRAMSALLQGVFLATLGIGVLVSTAYRVLVLNEPSAELMGGFALVALAVNVASAAVLMKHRVGDANVRAVWLFSRNDALGNVAVLIAAVMVGVMQTPWPDLVVAFVMAALFLQSSWSILVDARRELRGGM